MSDETPQAEKDAERLADFSSYLADLIELTQEAVDCWHQNQVPDWRWGQMMTKRLKSVQEKSAVVAAELGKLQDRLKCDACDGSGRAISGACGCEGNGVWGMLDTVREVLAICQQQNQQLEAELGAQKKENGRILARSAGYKVGRCACVVNEKDELLGECGLHREIREQLESKLAEARREIVATQKERNFYVERTNKENDHVTELIALVDKQAKEIERLKGEDYSDLLDQMDEAWGAAQEIGRVEINAFLESRMVHKPTTRLRTELAEARRLLDTARSYMDCQLGPDEPRCGDCRADLLAECDRLRAEVAEAQQRQQGAVRAAKLDMLSWAASIAENFGVTGYIGTSQHAAAQIRAERDAIAQPERKDP